MKKALVKEALAKEVLVLKVLALKALALRQLSRPLSSAGPINGTAANQQGPGSIHHHGIRPIGGPSWGRLQGAPWPQSLTTLWLLNG